MFDKKIMPKNYKNLQSNFVIFIRESFSKHDIDSIIKSLLKVEQIRK